LEILRRYRELDLRDSKGAIIRPTGSVNQHFGDQYNNYIQQTEKFPVPHQILSPPRNFTGRDDLISQILTGFSQGRTTIGLNGIGGLGKTALAYKLAEQLRDYYKGGQLMVDLKGTAANPLTSSQAMSKLLHYYYPAVSLPESQEELQSLYLSTLDGKYALVLLDNVLDDQQIRPLLPPPATCGMIITSRRQLENSEIFPIDLEVLKLDEAIKLLAKTARPHSPPILPEEEPLWKEIAEMCDCLPVALQAAGSYLACTPGSSPKQYIRELRDKRKRLKAIGKVGVEEDVLIKFSLSYSRLAPDTAQVFRLLSIFPADFFAEAEEAVCQDEGHQHLIELVRWSLAEYQRSDAEGEGRYHLHDLVGLFAAERLEEAEGEAAGNDARQRHAEHFRNVLSYATELYMNGNAAGGLKIFDLERMNIESAWAWAKENLAGRDAAATICNAFLNFPYLLDLRQHPRERISWMETALSAARKLNDRSMEGVHLGNLGLAYVYLGDAQKAIEYYEQALKIAREIGDRRNEGAWLGNLGIAYAALGDAKKAIEYYEQRLVIAREIGDQRGEGNALGNLGNAYAALGDARKATLYHDQALEIAREIGDRRGEGADLGNLGIAYKNLGDAQKAIVCHEQALAITREIGDKRAEGAILGNLGLAYAALGDAKKAIECHEQALAITREIGDKRAEGAILGNLGLAYAALGDAKKAIECHEQALAITREIGDKRAEGAILGNLGLAYAALGDAKKAIEYYELQLKIMQEIGDRRGESSVCWNLGLALEKAGDFQRAADLMQVCVDFEHEIGHPDTEKDAEYLENVRAKLREK
jgi:tetratricopeptide (TPR) repeat protein